MDIFLLFVGILIGVLIGVTVMFLLRPKEEHDWGKWEVLSEGNILNEWGSKIGKYIYMTRTCKITGEKQMKKVEKC